MKSMNTVPSTFVEVPPSQPVEVDRQWQLDSIKTVLTGLAGMVPVAGPFAGMVTSMLLSGLFPGGSTEGWEKMRDKIAEMIGEEFKAFYGRELSARIEGLHTALKNLDRAIQDKAKGSVILEYWTALMNALDSDLPHFKRDPKYSPYMLPLTAHAVNIFIVAARLLLANKEKWGARKDQVQRAEGDLKERVYRLSKVGNIVMPMPGTYTAYIHDAYVNTTREFIEKEKYYDLFRYTVTMYPCGLEYVNHLWEYLGETQKTVTEVHRDRVVWGGLSGWAGGTNRETRDFVNGLDGGRTSAPRTKERLTHLTVYIQEGGEHYPDIIAGFRMLRSGGWDPVVGIKPPEHCREENFRHGEWERIIKVETREKSVIYGFRVHRACSKTPENWIGSPDKGETERSYQVDPSYQLHDIRAFPGRGTVQRVVFGFRPVKTTLTWEKKQPRSGCFYRMIGDEGTLGLDSYNLADGAPVAFQPNRDSASQSWQFQDAGDGAWQLVNRFSGLYLAHEGDRIIQSRSGDAPHTLWRLVEADTFADRLVPADDPGQALTPTRTGPARIATSDAPEQRIALRLDPAPGLARLAGPQLAATARLDATQAGNTATITLTNPDHAPAVNDWHLSFHLPAGAGTEPRITGTDVVEITGAEKTPRGLKVTVTSNGSGQPTLAPGQSITFDLALLPPSGTAPDAVRPDEARLNDTLIETVGSGGPG
ncbi:hypothetical protein ACWGIB_05900 [Streptomyces xiamenensis]